MNGDGDGDGAGDGRSDVAAADNVVPLHAAADGPLAGLTIRRALPSDATAVAACMTHPRVLPQLLQLPFASEERWRALIQEQHVPAPAKADLMLVAELPADAGHPARVVGNAGLNSALQVRRRHVMLLGIAVLPEFQGRGVGSALMTALLDYADRWAQALRIELNVFCDNAAAIRLYERHGFRQEGRHVGYALRDGRYDDAFAMARLHPDPPTWRGGEPAPTN